MRWQWWFFIQALWSPGPWSSCSLPRGLPCGEGCLFFKLTSKRSFTSSFYPLILLTYFFNIIDQLQVFAPDLCPALVDHNTRSLFPIVSPRRHLFQVQLNTLWIVFWSNKLFQYFSLSPITVLPCGLQSAFLCPLLLVTMVGERYFTFLKSQSHTFTIMIALKQQQYVVAQSLSLGRCANNQNGNLTWYLPLGVNPPPPPLLMAKFQKSSAA